MNLRSSRRTVATSVGSLLVVGLLSVSTGCGSRPAGLKIDGSSTVYPISEAVAEEFSKVHSDVRVTVGLSGTGGGMKKFVAGEIDICDASRGIKESEATACTGAGVNYVELSVAFDGLAVIAHPENDWCDSLTVEQLALVWRPEDPASQWSELDPSWPDKPIKLYGPGTDSGTFDYFTKVIVGEEGACRPDYAASEDDNVLVTGVSEDKYSLGYFGFAYYIENQEKLKLLGVQQGEEPAVQPSLETVRSNSYRPLSRPLFIYVRESCYSRPEGKAFVDFYLDHAGELAGEVGYVPISDEVAAANREALESL